VVDVADHVEQMTLAQKLGDTPHVSVLLRKVCGLSGCDEKCVGEWLLKCAVSRGAAHYERDFPENLPPDHSALTDEEIGVALCLGQHSYRPVYLRAAAQLLSSPRVDPVRLCRFALMERVEPVLLFIAEVAARFTPQAEPWRHLRTHLRRRRSVPPDVLPHWSRFVSQTGVTAFGGGPDIRWLNRREPVG
jgi:hypothetical protein